MSCDFFSDVGQEEEGLGREEETEGREGTIIRTVRGQRLIVSFITQIIIIIGQTAKHLSGDVILH